MGILNDHANDKYYERANINIGKKEIRKALQNKSNIEFIKRLTESRSMVYIRCPSGIIKAIINKRNMEVITILPWHGDYKIEMLYCHQKYSKRYRIILYPDCYLETNSNRHLTKISVISENNEEIENIPVNHPHFDYLFTKAWERYSKGVE